MLPPKHLRDAGASNWWSRQLGGANVCWDGSTREPRFAMLIGEPVALICVARSTCACSLSQTFLFKCSRALTFFLDDQMQRRNCFISIISIYNCISCMCIYDTGGYLLYVTRTVPSYLVTSNILHPVSTESTVIDRWYRDYIIYIIIFIDCHCTFTCPINVTRTMTMMILLQKTLELISDLPEFFHGDKLYYMKRGLARRLL